MRKVLIVLLLLLISSTMAYADYVSGYQRNNGTYVRGYYKSSPDSFKQNNYSYKGNTNPYTGKKGYNSGIPKMRTNNTYRPYKSKMLNY